MNFQLQFSVCQTLPVGLSSKCGLYLARITVCFKIKGGTRVKLNFIKLLALDFQFASHFFILTLKTLYIQWQH